MQQIKFGIIGTNSISDKIIAAGGGDKRFVLSAVYSRTEETAKKFAEKHNIPHTFTSLQKMASSSVIDAVYIASPNSFHAQQSILFMEHGKHVLCEKPLASNAKEVKKMIETSQKKRVTLMEAMMPTLKREFDVVQDSIKKIGQVRHYFASYCQYSSRYDDLRAGIVHNAFKPEFSNGAVVDIGTYTIYPMIVLFGKPKKVNAAGLITKSGVDANGTVHFEYDRMNATVIYSKISDSSLPSEIQGEDGYIIIDKINYMKEISLKYRDRDKKEYLFPIQDFDDYFHEIKEFIDLIIAGKIESEINSHQNSLETIEIIDEIRKQIGVSFPADL
ncbi:MAG: Gfo/Idh/MocA family oxidoreductase [Marinilabiliaceae bacterium]|nr:Gfo/Idh/MocA family oxidoreductase [Marinilabiliaceae bacterium]